MSLWQTIICNLPEVAGPTQRKLAFKEKLKWTGIVLLLFFVLGLIPLFGLGQNALQQFEFLSVILGAEFGSIISLGIGPLVTASIVLQLLNGAGIVKFDLKTEDGKRTYQGTQKLLSIFFILFEGAVYVLMGGLTPEMSLAGSGLYFQLELILIFQLFLGGLLIMFMDEIVSKWGFGSGISLFIAAGVSKSLFIRALSPLASPTNPEMPTGAIPALFKSVAGGDFITAALMIAAVLATILIFMLAVYGQSMKVEIPLSFGRVRGHGIRWPLAFMYTSNIPVILVAALLANIQLWARLLERWGHPILGTFSGNSPISGLVAWVNPPQLLHKIITGSMTIGDIGVALFYTLVMVGGAVLFSYFWVKTSGMDAESQAKQIMSSGLQIPGFRRDPRIMERLLQRYISPLTILGGAAIGFLAAFADVLGSLTHGTSLLLAVMIVYKLYEEIAKQHMYDMNPMLRKFMEV